MCRQGSLPGEKDSANNSWRAQLPCIEGSAIGIWRTQSGHEASTAGAVATSMAGGYSGNRLRIRFISRDGSILGWQ
eukprot:3146512-Karenia_brevis.AAC.1